MLVAIYDLHMEIYSWGNRSDFWIRLEDIRYLSIVIKYYLFVEGNRVYREWNIGGG